RYASVLAGQASPEKERLTALQCLFRGMPPSQPDITQKGQTTSFTIRTDYIAFGMVDPPSVNADGLQLTARIYSYGPGSGSWPGGTKIILKVKAPSRHVTYSKPPSQRDAGTLTWTWTLTSSDTNANGDKPVTITVPLGAGERLTALLQYSPGP